MKAKLRLTQSEAGDAQAPAVRNRAEAAVWSGHTTMAGTVDPTLMRKTSRTMGLLICELSVPDFFLNNSLRTATPFNIAFLRYFF